MHVYPLITHHNPFAVRLCKTLKTSNVDFVDSALWHDPACSHRAGPRCGIRKIAEAALNMPSVSFLFVPSTNYQ